MIQAKIALIGSPPGKCPTKLFAKSTILLADEPLLINEPAKINIGIAIKAGLSPVIIVSGTAKMSCDEKNIIVTTAETPKDTATGTPSKSKPKSKSIKTKTLIPNPL